MTPVSGDPPHPGRPTCARIDLEAFAHNVRLAVRLAGPDRRVLAVVKADAYGHGAVRAARAALAAGALKLGVATPGEVRSLRAAGIDAPVLLLSEVAPDRAAEMIRLGCSLTLYSLAYAEALGREAQREGRRVMVHLKVDTGMGRLGIAPADALPFVARLHDFPQLVLDGIMTHPSEAEVRQSPVTAGQISTFHAVCSAIEAIAGHVRWRHIANSALVLLGDPAGNLVRPGIMLYGAAPAPDLPGVGELRPVMSLATAVAFLKRVPGGTPLSYGGTFRTRRESLIATLPIGYADGYRRAFSNRASVLVRGQRAPVVGRVCMDLCLVDVTGIPEVAVGDEVVLLGGQGGELITADELAAHAETISYEIFCGIGPRVPRVYSGSPAADADLGSAAEIPPPGARPDGPHDSRAGRMSGKSRYLCQGCGFVSPKWLGRCPDCGSWNTLIEEVTSGTRSSKARAAGETDARPQSLDAISAADAPRIPTGSSELDRVLGGGLVPGSVVLLGGDPGIGKTTLLLEYLGRLAASRSEPVLYCSGEESPRQIKLRADRIGLSTDRLVVFSQNALEPVLAEIRRLRPVAVVVDSIQTITTAALESTAGSISQVREVASQLIAVAKRQEVPVFLVGHVTKDGTLAGPRVLEHMVDTVLYFEGENTRDFRILRAVKNRFGSTNEIGVFEMGDGGLREVANPSRLFLREDRRELAGSVVTAAVEGTRPFLVEVQALCAHSSFVSPKRGCSGTDAGRLAMLIAILEKKLGLILADQDVYLNLAGGIRVVEPAIDLAIALAVFSSFRNSVVDPGMVVFGEVGLTGEVRGVSNPEFRVKEAAKLGFRTCLIPSANVPRVASLEQEITICGVSTLAEVVDRMIL